MPRAAFYIWLFASLAWALAVGIYAFDNWPHLPLDISHTDPATKSAYDEAVLRHAGWHAAVALLPPLALLGILQVILRR